MSEIVAWEAIRRVITDLPTLIQDGQNLRSRSSLAWADTLAGLSICAAGAHRGTRSNISIEMATDWIIEAAKALSQKEFAADAVTAERTKVDPALLDAIDVALARQVPSVNEGAKQKEIVSETSA